MNKNFLVLFFIIFITINHFVKAETRVEAIPFKADNILPAMDLVYEGDVLDAERALEMSVSKKIDLSTLNPKDDVFWNHTIKSQNDNIYFEDKPFEFSGVLAGIKGWTRLRVIQDKRDVNTNGISRTSYILLFDKYLHSLFLRKNLLRKLGYKIPKMKYLKTAKLKFETLEQKKYFLNSVLPNSKMTFGDPKRWINKQDVEDDKILTITIRDIALLKKERTDFKNLMIGPTNASKGRRVIRSLIVPFSMTAMEESVNSFDFKLGNIINENLLLKHTLSMTRFDADINDVVWMLQRLKKITRSDYREIVQESFFPKGVSEIVLEKLISRRNTLLSLVNRRIHKIKFKKIALNKKHFNVENIVENGNVIKKNWKHYASNFAYNNAVSPFDDYRYFFYSKLKSSLLSNLISEMNTYFKSFDLKAAKIKFLRNQFDSGLQHFIKTGQFTTFPVKVWHSPYFKYGLIASRDIVIGNYMGSDNLIQLADTLGFYMDPGMYYGVENIGVNKIANFRFGSNIVITATHLQPVLSLKDAYHVPYSQLFAGTLKYKKAFLKIFNSTKDENNIKKKELADSIANFKKYLKVGESLIITQSIMPHMNINASFVLSNLVLSPSISSDYKIINRIQLYRSSSDNIKVYSDTGNVWNVRVSVSGTIGVENSKIQIPLTRFEINRDSGKYDMRVFNLNLSEDISKNHNLSKNAYALYQIFAHNSTKSLEELSTPIIVKNNFLDKTSKFNFLFLTNKVLYSQGLIEVTPPHQKKMSFINLIHDDLFGINKELIVRDGVNYLLNKYININPKLKWNSTISLANNTFKNPHDTISGSSVSHKSRLQVKIGNQGSERYDVLSLSTRYRGWSIDNGEIQNIIKKIEGRYGKKLFSSVSLISLNLLRLYDIRVFINIYRKGYEQILHLKPEIFSSLKIEYMSRRKNNRCYKIKNVKCEKFDRLIYYAKKCKTYRDKLAYHQCFLDFAETMFKSLDVKDFYKLIGKDNFHLFATVNGYRTDNEKINANIKSESYGKVSSVLFNGPLEAVINYLQLSTGEFYGWWFREQI